MAFFNSALDVLQTLAIALARASVRGVSTFWRGAKMTILARMGRVHKEASVEYENNEKRQLTDACRLSD